MFAELKKQHPIDWGNFEKIVDTFCNQGWIVNPTIFRNENEDFYSIKTRTKRFYGYLVRGDKMLTFILLHEFKKQDNKKERNDAVEICKQRLTELGDDLEEIRRN